MVQSVELLRSDAVLRPGMKWVVADQALYWRLANILGQDCVSLEGV